MCCVAIPIAVTPWQAYIMTQNIGQTDHTGKCVIHCAYRGHIIRATAKVGRMT